MRSTVHTVQGEIDADDLGYVLPHEHLVYFPVDQDKSTYQETYDLFVPIYKELVDRYNCRTIVECSPKLVRNSVKDEVACYIPGSEKRTNIELVKRISKDSGMNIVLATGYYREYARPSNFKSRTASEIAKEMIEEITVGIDASGVKAGIIKIGVSDLSIEGDRKLLLAASIAHKETGVSITTHTTTPMIRLSTLDFLEGAGVQPDKIYLGHADSNGEITESISLAKRGCNLIYTIWGIDLPSMIEWEKGPLPKHYSAYLCAALVGEGYADRVLLSIDFAASYLDGKLTLDIYEIPERTSLYAYTYVIPRLKELGINQEYIDKIMKSNPKRMLT